MPSTTKLQDYTIVVYIIFQSEVLNTEHRDALA